MNRFFTRRAFLAIIILLFFCLVLTLGNNSFCVLPPPGPTPTPCKLTNSICATKTCNGVDLVNCYCTHCKFGNPCKSNNDCAPCCYCLSNYCHVKQACINAGIGHCWAQPPSPTPSPTPGGPTPTPTPPPFSNGSNCCIVRPDGSCVFATIEPCAFSPPGWPGVCQTIFDTVTGKFSCGCQPTVICGDGVISPSFEVCDPPGGTNGCPDPTTRCNSACTGCENVVTFEYENLSRSTFKEKEKR